MHLHNIIRLLLVCTLFAACGKGGGGKEEEQPFKGPFSKVYRGTLSGRPITIELTRTPYVDDTGWAQDFEGSWFVDSANAGLFSDASENNDSNAFRIRLTQSYMEEDTARVLALRVSPGAGRLSGWYLQGKAGGYPTGFTGAPDSLAFEAVEDAEVTRFDLNYADAWAKLYPDLKYAPTFAGKATLLLPGAHSGLDTAVARRIRASLCRLAYKVSDTATNPADSVVRRMKKEYLASHAGDQAPTAADSELYQRMHMSQWMRTQVAHLGKKYVAVEVNNGYIESMPHPYEETSYYSFDCATGSLVQLADVLPPGSATRLPALLAAAVRKQRGLKPGEPLSKAGLFSNSIRPGKRFYMQDTAVVFCYDPYEIGPYSEGNFQLPVSLRALQNPN